MLAAISIAQLISLLGSQLSGFGLGVWVYQRTGSATLYGITVVMTLGPALLAQPWAGGYVDRRGPIRALLLSNGIAAAGMTLMALSLRRTDAPIWQFLVLLAVVSAATSLEMPAVASLTTRIVAGAQLGRANGLLQMAFAGAQVLGPFTGGALYGRIGLVGLLAIDATSFVIAGLIVSRVRVPAPAAGMRGGPSDSWAQAFLSGVAYLRRGPGMLALLGLLAIVTFNLGVVQVATGPLVLSFSNARGLGTVLSAAGLGMLLGGATMAIWGGSGRRDARHLLTFLTVQGALIVAASLSRSVPTMAACAFGVMFTVPRVNACAQSIWQRSIPVEAQGRVFAVRAMVGRALVPIAYLVGGLWVESIAVPVPGAVAGSHPTVFASSGAAQVLGILGAITLAVATISWMNRGLRTLDRAPSAI